MATKARQQYFADEISLQKDSREFSIEDSIKQKIDSVEAGAQVNTIETVKVNGTALTPDANKAVDVEVPEVIDNLYTTSTDDALSAKQGKVLYDYIQNIASRGRFLSNWNSATGLPMTNPSESPYTYRTGDYFIVSNIAGLGGTNYRPDGSLYIIGQASTVAETDSVDVSDFYFYDGTNWLLLKNSTRSGAVDSSLSTSSTNPVENRVITNALNGKHPGEISNTAPASPVEGMLWYDTVNDELKVYNGSQWATTGSGGGSGDVVGPASATDGHLAVFDGATGKLIKDGGAMPTIPTKVSDLSNDSGFITSAALPTKVSDLSNDSGFITGIDSGDVTTALGYTPYNSSNPSGYITSSDIPTDVSDFNNDAGYLTSSTGVTSVNGNHGAVSLTIPSVSTITVTLTSAGWSSKTQTVSATGVTANNSVIISPAPANLEDYTEAGIYCSSQGSGTLTFTCEEEPTSNLSVNVVILS